jgi:hypothetical protein
MSDAERSAKMNPASDIISAHRFCTGNRQLIEQSSVCGCFYCLSIFTPEKITHWLDEGAGTAMCPECDIDSVIGSKAGFPITKEFLSEMKAHWF